MFNSTAQLVMPETLFAAGGVAILPHLLLASFYVFISAMAGRFTLKNVRHSKSRIIILLGVGIIFIAGLNHGGFLLLQRLGWEVWQLGTSWSLIPVSVVAVGIGIAMLYQHNQHTEDGGHENLQHQFSLFPTGLIAVNQQLNIVAINAEAASIFEYLPEQLLGKPLNLLVPAAGANAHSKKMHDYWTNPSQNHAMNAARFVCGVSRHGQEVYIEVRLFHKTINGTALVLASLNNVGEAEQQKNQAHTRFQRLKRAMDASNDGFWEWNPHTGAVWFNSAFIRMTHHKPFAQPAWEHWLEHIHPEDIAAVKQALEQQLHETDHFDVSYRGYTNKGEWEWLRMKGARVRDEKGHSRVGGTLTNIHVERRSAELQAEKIRALNDLLDQSGCALSLYHLGNHCHSYVNAEFTELTGFSLGDLVAHSEQSSLLELYHPDDRDQVLAHWNALVTQASDIPVTVNFRVKHKQGDFIWCRATHRIFQRTTDGKPVEVLCSLVDMSQIRDQLEGLRDVQNHSKPLFQYSNTAMAEVSKSGHLRMVNLAFEDLLGVSDEKLNGLLLDHLIAPGDKASFRKSVDTYLVKQRFDQPLQLNLALLAHPDSIFRLTLTPAKTDDEKHFFVLSIEDISALTQLQQQLAASHDTMERFFYAASHDLQEPLRKISAFVSALERRLKSTLNDQDGLYELDRVGDAARRMSEMLKGLLDISRVSRARLNLQTVTFNDLLARTLEPLQRDIDSAEAEIQLPDDFELRVDIETMSQSLCNIMENSLLYRHPDRRPVISLRHDQAEGKHRIWIADNGRGIKPEFRERVFEPFTRCADKSIPGSGLGLTYCKQVFEAHDGEIYVAHPSDHDPQAEGLTLVLELPAV